MEQLYRVGDMDWWILVDTEEKDIIEKYHKPQVQADINAIKETLSGFPDLTTQELYFDGIVSLIQESKYTEKQKEGAKKLLEDMWLAYEGSLEFLERTDLSNRLEELENILVKMA